MSDIRDLAIIILAAIFILIGLGFGVLLVMLISLTVVVRRKAGPILDSARETLSNIEGTSSVVSHAVVRPIARAAGFAVGLRRAVGILTRLNKKKGGQRR